MSMTFAIELTDEEEACIRQDASAQGKDLDSYVRGLLLNGRQRPSSDTQPPTAGARLLAELQACGALGIWQDRPDSPAFARHLRERAEKRAGEQ